MTGPGPGLPPHPGLTGRPVRLDYNATTPVDPRVADAMLPHLTDFFGNPSSSHPHGAEPRRALAEAHARVAELVGAPGALRLPLGRWTTPEDIGTAATALIRAAAAHRHTTDRAGPGPVRHHARTPAPLPRKRT